MSRGGAVRGGTELVVTEESRRPATRAAATCQVPVNIRESPSYTVYLGDGLGRLGAGGGKAACCGGYASSASSSSTMTQILAKLRRSHSSRLPQPSSAPQHNSELRAFYPGQYQLILNNTGPHARSTWTADAHAAWNKTVWNLSPGILQAQRHHPFGLPSQWKRQDHLPSGTGSTTGTRRVLIPVWQDHNHFGELSLNPASWTWLNPLL